ncbi:MAG: hypothetical protein H6737_05580 [Alphaproteobacteria bacterium]|nr:hypothetical protein [Alphaproteobacteria bacterium]
MILEPAEEAVRAAHLAWLEVAGPALHEAIAALPARLPAFDGYVLYVSWIRSTGPPQLFAIQTVDGVQEPDSYGALCALEHAVDAARAVDAAWDALERAHVQARDAAFQAWLEDSDGLLFEAIDTPFDASRVERTLVHDLAWALAWPHADRWAWLEVGSTPDWRVDLRDRRVILAP